MLASSVTYGRQFLSNHAWKFVSLFVALTPTAKLSNVGYVDPNLYIGYSQIPNWLISSGGFEYHATRFPYYSLLSLIDNFGSSYLGLFYRSVMIFGLLLSVHLFVKKLKLPLFIEVMCLLAVGYHPVSTSISSMTFANGFSTTVGIIALSLCFYRNKRFTTYWIIPSLLLLSLLSNAWIGISSLVSVMAVILIFEHGSRKVMMLVMSVSVAVQGFLLECIWRFGFGIDGGLWVSHYKIISKSSSTIGFGEWRSIFEIYESGQSIAPFFGVFFAGIVFPISVMIRKRRNFDIKSIELQLSLLLISAGIVSLFSHFVRINPQFSSPWYYYGNLSIFIVAILLAVVYFEKISLRLFIFSILQIELLALTLSIGRTTVLLLELATLGIVIAVHGVQLSQAFLNSKIQSFALPIILAFSIMTPLLNGFFLNSYSTTGNSLAKKFHFDQIALTNYVRSLNSQKHYVSTWISKGDQSGYTGSLQSTLSFHLLRLEGSSVDSLQPSVNRWLTEFGFFPKTIVIITRSEDETRNLDFDCNCSYRLENKFFLPSKKALISEFTLVEDK